MSVRQRGRGATTNGTSATTADSSAASDPLNKLLNAALPPKPEIISKVKLTPSFNPTYEYELLVLFTILIVTCWFVKQYLIFHVALLIVVVIAAYALSDQTDGGWYLNARKLSSSGLLLACLTVPLLLLAMACTTIYSNNTVFSKLLPLTSHIPILQCFWIVINTIILFQLAIIRGSTSYDAITDARILILAASAVTLVLQQLQSYAPQHSAVVYDSANNVGFEALAITNVIALTLHTVISTRIQHSFTLGESMTIIQLLTLAFSTVIKTALSHTEVDLLTRRLHGVPTLNNEVLACGVVLVPTVLLLGMWIDSSWSHMKAESDKQALKADDDKSKDKVQSVNKTKRKAAARSSNVRDAYIWLLVCIFTICWLVVGWTIQHEPLTWLVNYMADASTAELRVGNLPVRLVLIAYWVALLAVTVTIAPAGQQLNAAATINGTPQAARRRLSNIVIRKYYHALAALIYAPPLLLNYSASNLQFLAFATSVAITLFVFTEYIRLARLPPVGDAIHAFMSQYVDQRDDGTVILTHLYLLIGAGLPVCLTAIQQALLSSSSITSSPSTFVPMLTALSGVFIVGIGDSVASLAGKTYGRHRWPDSRKTIEGTVSAIAAVLISIAVVQSIALALGTIVTTLTLTQWLWVALSTVIVCLLEAFIDAIDNMYLPMLYYAMLSVTIVG